MRSSSVAQIGDEVTYALGPSENPFKPGTELVDAVISAWKRAELITICDSHHKTDRQSLRILKQVFYFLV